jgi:hypothetical protein
MKGILTRLVSIRIVKNFGSDVRASPTEVLERTP